MPPETEVRMSVRNLDKLFKPRSVVLIGASPRPRSVGAVIVRNLRRAGFAQRIERVHDLAFAPAEAVRGLLGSLFTRSPGAAARHAKNLAGVFRAVNRRRAR